MKSKYFICGQRVAVLRPLVQSLVLCGFYCVSVPVTSASILANAESINPTIVTQDGTPSVVNESITQEDINLPTVVVTPNPLEQLLLTDVLPATSVITRADIEHFSARSVYDVLTHVPALELARSGGAGQPTSLFMRGAESDHVLVLVDGLPVNMGAVGSGDALSYIQPEDINSIEVVRGNVSALYGSQAIGGVIHIKTRTGGKKPHLTFTGEVGTRGTHGMGLTTGGQLEGLKIAGGLSYRKQGSNSATVIGNQDRDSLKNWGGHLNLGVDLAKGHEINLQAGYRRNRIMYDDYYAPLTESSVGKGYLSHWQLNGRHDLTSKWRNQWRVGQSIENRNDSKFSSANSQSASHNRIQNFTIANTNQIDLPGKMKAGLTLEWQRQGLLSNYDSQSEFGPYSVSLDRHRTMRSASLQLSGDWEQHQLQTAVRHDRYSDFGNATTGLLAYGYQFNPHWRANLQWSNGFRAPSLSDLYYPNFSNPSLKPERSNNWEAGLQWANPQMMWRLTAFHTKFRNLIQTSGQGVGNPALSNIGRATNKGIELMGKMALLPTTHLQFSLTVQNPKDGNGDRLLRRSRFMASTSIVHQLQSMDISGRLRYAGNRTDLNFNSVDFSSSPITLPPFWQLDLAANYRIDKALKAGMRLENVFNRKKQEVWGYAPQPRGIFLQLQFQPLR